MNPECERHEAGGALNAYVDGGALSPLARWRVRRHLRRCPRCAAEVASLRRLSAAARRLYDEIPAPGGWAAAAAAVLSGGSSAPRRRRRRAVALALSGVAAAAAGLTALALSPGTPVRPSVALAQVEAALGEIRTARWVETQYDYNPDGSLGMRASREHFARLDPPALASRGVPGGAWVDGKNFLGVVPGRGVTTPERSVYATAGTFSIRPVGGLGKPRPADEVRRRIVFSLVAPDRAKGESYAISLWSFRNYPWKTRHVSESGRAGRLFEFTRTSDGGAAGDPYARRITQTILVDAGTRRVVRREHVQHFLRDGRLDVRIVADQFRYNEPLPPETFVLEPAPGQKVVDYTRERARPVWDTLSPAERREIRSLLQRAEDAWRRYNFAAFARLWDFDYLSTIPGVTTTGKQRRRMWQVRSGNRRTYQYRPFRPGVVSVESAVAQNYFVSGTYLPEGAPDLLRVSVRNTAGRMDNAADARTSYLLRRVPGGGFRIVHRD